MITALTGILRWVGEDRLHLSCGPVVVELLIASADVPLVDGRNGESLTLHTVAYVEGDGAGGNLAPRLIGFLREGDRDFFQKFITVKGIGPRKALRALAVPAGEVAAAIEGRDLRTLVKLPQIGKRAAEQIVAELAGKVGRFVPSGVAVEAAGGIGRLSQEEQDAVDTVVALGERRSEAEALLARARADAPQPATTDALVRAMLRARALR